MEQSQNQGEGTGRGPRIEGLLSACRMKRHLYTPREIAFLHDVGAGRYSLSEAQMGWLLALSDREPINYEAINSRALTVMEALCRRWLGDGKLQGKEWVACNPTRADASAGSFRINVSTGRWADFATKDGGGDPISLAAFLFHQGDQRAAALSLKAMLGA